MNGHYITAKEERELEKVLAKRDSAIRKAIAREIFEEIEDTFASVDYTGRKRSVSFVLECNPWQALKTKYGGEG